MYNTGESVDSNPIVASLNPSKPTSEGSPSNHSPDHSSDEETRGPTSKGHSDHTLDTATQPFTYNPQGNNSQEEQPLQNENGETDNDKPGTGISDIQDSYTFAHFTPTHEIPHSTLSVVDETPPVSNPTLPPESPPFHFEKTKHITVDTVSVPSGDTIEYSLPPSVASTFADSPLELVDKDTNSSDSDSTTASSITDKTNEQIEDPQFVSKPTKVVTNVPTISGVPTTSIQTFPSTTSTSVSASLVETVSPISHGFVQGQLSISGQHESSLVNTLQVQSENNVFSTNKADNFTTANSRLDISTNIPQVIPLKEENAFLNATEPLGTTPLSPPEIVSTMTSRQPIVVEPSTVSEAATRKADATVSSYAVSATVTKPVTANMMREIDTVSQSLKTNNFGAIPGSPRVSNSTSTVSAQPQEHVSVNNSSTTSSDVASQLLIELEKSLSQSD